MRMENAYVILDGKEKIVVKDFVQIIVMKMEYAHHKEFVHVKVPGKELIVQIENVIKDVMIEESVQKVNVFVPQDGQENIVN